ncbi:MAG: VWA domain-containing protein [Actinobacteria bacterium]|nr:MAG: VWA domain-containing protein [Actinomycetota bacterium]
MAAVAKKQQASGKDAKDRTILINFVLDKSGSMDSIREATISGFNEFKNDQVREEGNALFTLTLFDTEFDLVCEAVPVREVADLDRRSYQPDGCTALYDAIGHTMRITDDFVAAHKPDQVVFVIMTDGEENSSREFTHQTIFQMIQDRQKLAHYEFIYLGANQDSYATGAQIGMRDGRMADYDATHDGARHAWERASMNLKAHRRMGTAQRDEFFTQRMEDLGAIDAETWKRMGAEERKRRMDEAEGDEASA